MGGITTDGVENIKKFVNNGGILVCNGGSSEFAIQEFRLPFKNALQGVRSEEFSCPGSILKMNFKTDHPLAFGMQEEGITYFSRDIIFEYDAEPESPEAKRAPSKKAANEAEAPPEKESPPAKKPYVQEKAKVTYKDVASFPDESLLLSGWILGDEILRKKTTVLDIDFGKGKLILFGFNVHNRAQSYSTFKLLFNSLLY